jgi:3-oxoacyl-[acyl-carrier-protein] synthase II
MKPIAITRIAVLSAIGNSLEENVSALEACAVGVRPPTDLEQRPAITSGAGEAPLPESERGAWRSEILMRRALAGLLRDEEWREIHAQSERWCAVIGTTLAGMRHCGEGMRSDESGDLDAADRSYSRITASSVLAHSLAKAGFTGASTSVSCACASALSAVNHGCSLLESGTFDAVIAGGYDPIAEFAYGGFAALQLVAQGPLSPFAPDREGMKLGEGAALFVLRRLEDVPAERQHEIRAVIVARGESSDSHHLTQPHPEGAGAARALRQAGCGGDAVHIDSGRAIPELPELLVAHATGTPGNDAAEYLAYRQTFGARLPEVPVAALKSRFGHPLGAAGALELAAAIGCAESGFMPSSAGRGRDREQFTELALIEGAPVRTAPRDVVALSAGFGGANAATRIQRPGADGRLPTPGAGRGETAADTRASCRVRLAITAVGAVSPLGRGAERLMAEDDSPEPWPAFDEAILAPLVDRARARRLALLPRLMIGAVRDLVESASLTAEEVKDIPLIAANWCGAADFTERYYRDLIRSGIDLANPMLFAESVPNIGSAQCSLAFGIRAPTISVIGRRTAALEALLLAQARIATGEWERAIVVASEEAHPIVRRVLERCAGTTVEQNSAAIAVLVERASGTQASAAAGTGPGAVVGAVVGAVRGTTSPVEAHRPRDAWRGLIDPAHLANDAPARAAAIITSRSPLDAIDAPPAAVPVGSRAELGAASPIAALLSGQARPLAGADPWVLAASDPHGARWAVEIH